MKKSKFTETQIIAVLKQGDAGVPIKDLCRQAGISSATSPVEVEVRRHGGVRAAAREGARGRERQAQADVRRAGPRQRCDEGPDRKKRFFSQLRGERRTADPAELLFSRQQN